MTRKILVSSSGTPLRRRTFLAATIAAAAAASSACGFGDDTGGGSDDDSGDGDSGESQRGGTLRQSMLPVTHLDPAVRGNFSFGQIMMIGLWEGLVVVDGDDPSQVLPGVAESWDISDDGLVYTFHLRNNAKWSNGDTVTADDFEWNWQRILTPGIAGEGNPSFDPSAVPIVGAEAYMNGETDDFTTVGAKAVDDVTFELTLEQPNPDLLINLAQYWALPLHPATVDELGDAWLDPENWVSNGAYILDDFRVNQGAVLLPNQQYWDRDSYHVDRWEVTFNDGGTTADLLAYQNDEIDITGRIEDDLDAVTTSDVADELISTPFNQYRSLWMLGSRNPAAADVRVRKALALAIDRDALASTATPAVAGASLLPAAVEGSSEVPGVGYDVEQAQSLLTEAGYEGGQGMPTITLLDFQSSPWVEAIAQMWKDNFGLDVVLDIVEIGVYGEKRAELHPEDYFGFVVVNAAVNPPTLYAAASGMKPNDVRLNGMNLAPIDVLDELVNARDAGATPAELQNILEGNRLPEIEEALDLASQALDQTDPQRQRELILDAVVARDEAYVQIPVLWGGYNLLVKPRVQNLKYWSHASVMTTKGLTLDT